MEPQIHRYESLLNKGCTQIARMDQYIHFCKQEGTHLKDRRGAVKAAPLRLKFNIIYAGLFAPLQPFHDLHKSFQRICSRIVRLLTLKHHVIFVLFPGQLCPLVTDFGFP